MTEKYRGVTIKTEKEIDLIEKSCRIVAETLKELEKYVKPGATTLELDTIAEDYIRSKGGIPAFKNYQPDKSVYPFPGTLCTSIDEEVVHGIPSERKLEEGQIVSIDCGCEKDGYFGDSAVTYAVGKISEEKQKLMDATNEALFKGIEAATEGNKIFDIAREIQTYVEKRGYSVTRELVGHGIGSRLHEEPPVPNFVPPLLHRQSYPNVKLKSNMTIAIEPMVHMGKRSVISLANKWTIVTADKSPAAHFEHSICVRKDKAFILTLRD